MKKTNWVRFSILKQMLSTVKIPIFIAFIIAIAKIALAQPKDPCNDTELLRLKALPKASLTESERKILNKLNADCEKFKQQAESKQMQSPTANTPKQHQPSDTAKVILKEEPFATTRNFTILGAMCAVITGIIIAINSIAESPF
jgi:hypothetical protein